MCEFFSAECVELRISVDPEALKLLG